jgi:hypothetical protein
LAIGLFFIFASSFLSKFAVKSDQELELKDVTLSNLQVLLYSAIGIYLAVTTLPQLVYHIASYVHLLTQEPVANAALFPSKWNVYSIIIKMVACILLVCFPKQIHEKISKISGNSKENC